MHDVKTHCETLMRKAYGLKAHLEIVKENVADIQYECASVEVEKMDGVKITIDDK